MTYTDATALLREFVSIKSVSADSTKQNEMRAAVKFLEYHLVRLGFTVKLINTRNHNPIIIAKRIVKSSATTIGIYGHYDVQPEDPIDEWKTSPFILTRKNGKLYGRGVADNKGHIIQNLAAIENLIHKKQLHSNIVCIFEGEEESGESINFEKSMKAAKKLLASVDLYMITDTGMHKKNVPQIFFGLRGLTYFELSVETGESDLHSGEYGNRVYNPISVLNTLFSEMRDKTGKILIPGFYDKVRRPTKLEFSLLSKVKKTDTEDMKDTRVHALPSFFTVLPELSAKINPSCDLHGIYSGYAGEGAKTVIPRSATAKFSFRLIEHQDPKKISELISAYIKKNLPKGIKYSLKNYEASPAFYTDITDRYMQKTAEVLAKTFNHETLYNRSGGSIPAAEILQRLFKKPVILTGFTLPDDNIHAPNENFDEDMFFKGITALERIYSTL